jgi:cytochrome c-type biogenesis protein CcmH
MIDRRRFLAGLAGGSASLLAASRVWAQQPGQPARGMMHDSLVVQKDSTNLFAMDQGAAQPVRLPPKPGVAPQLTDLERDALERRIHCQCGCTLDVFTCRTTDFSCRVSPAMHRDVMELVRGGYSAQEILDAFVGVYGERALMAPKKSGFNLLAWVMPGTAVIVAGGVLMVLLRKWGDRARQPHALAPLKTETDATPEELAELEAAVRGEDHQ